MSYYVKVQNGQIVGEIKTLSISGSASPNIRWKLPQMKANGFYPVEMPSVVSSKQKIDYDMPEILADKVKYKAKNKPLSDLKKDKLMGIKEKARRAIFKKYSLENQIFASLEAYGQTYIDQMKADIKKIVDESVVMETACENAMSDAELDAINTDFSEI